MKNLSFAQCYFLLQSVFKLGREEKGLTIMTDLPTEEVHDHAAWQDRRRIATDWFLAFQSNIRALPFTSVSFCAYKNVGINNSELPDKVVLIDRCTRDVPSVGSETLLLAEVLSQSSVVLSITEFSATAPLKVLARRWKFRGATLPGFTREMIPALVLDYGKVHNRVMVFKERLDRAQVAHATFRVGVKEYHLNVDLRYRAAHASGGLIQEPGMVANLPSGEAYIVPYEGERVGDPSASSGVLPVQFGDEVVLFGVEHNRVQSVQSIGPQSDHQRRRLLEEPAFGNIAELGIGVLAEFGVKGGAGMLLDEKLGLHFAFGRSDHFGGFTGPEKFLDPARVEHIDWVYVPTAQPDVLAAELTLRYENEKEETVLRDGKLTV